MSILTAFDRGGSCALIFLTCGTRYDFTSEDYCIIELTEMCQYYICPEFFDLKVLTIITK